MTARQEKQVQRRTRSQTVETQRPSWTGGALGRYRRVLRAYWRLSVTSATGFRRCSAWPAACSSRPATCERLEALRSDEAAAGIVVACELTLISLIRKRFLDVPLRLSLLQVALGGVLIVAVGVLLGSA